jgi:hypothetical protein
MAPNWLARRHVGLRIGAGQIRLSAEPNERNGLRSPCRLMVDKITTVPKSEVGARLGRLDDEDMAPLNQAMMVFLGLAAPPRLGRKANERWRFPAPPLLSGGPRPLPRASLRAPRPAAGRDVDLSHSAKRRFRRFCRDGQTAQVTPAGCIRAA